jgi:hypothetical protein
MSSEKFEGDRQRWLELQRIAPLKEAARLRGVSEDSLLRNDRDKVLQLGPRRLGMRVRDALLIKED